MAYPYHAIPLIGTTSGNIEQSDVILTASNNAYVHDYPQNLNVISTRRFANELITAGVNNEITVLTLNSGSYLTMSYGLIDTDSAGTYIRNVTANFYKSDQTLAFTMGGGAYNNYLTGVPSGYGVLCFAYVIYDIDGVYKVAGMNLLMRDHDNLPWPASVDYLADASQWFHESDIPPEYTWTAWNQIAGNNGQYRCNLTTIKDDSIGDISGANYGTGNDLMRITQSSDVVPYIRNMNYNSPVKIAYSGVNWMTAEIQPETGLLTNQVKCVFKFYIKNVSETTPFYSLTEYFFVGESDHHYLSFVHDDEQQAAAFLPVGFDKALTSSPYYWGNVSPSESEINLLWLWLQASGTPTPDPQPSRPYDNGTTDNGGLGGNPIPQDDIHTPNVPMLGAMASGMFTVYCPNDTQLGQIADYLWSDSFIDNVKKYFNNVSDNIIAFYVLPLEPESLPTKNFKIGNLENSSISGVKYLNSRFISVDMGSVTVESRWDTYLDFSPFTRFNCYLPGVGIVALDSDDIMSPANLDGSLPTLTGSTISLTYVIDLFTGVLVAYVKIDGQIRYQFPGRMGYSIPLTGQNYTAMGQGFVTAMAGLASTIATGGTAAPFTAGATAAGIVNAMKPDVYRGGNLSGDASMLSLKTPILIRTRPNKPAIENQELFSGAPSYKIGTIGNFGGFTQVAEAHIEGISCTEAERSEIMQLLRNGVLI